MGFFDWVKNSIDKVRTVEERLYNDKTKVFEIYLAIINKKFYFCLVILNKMHTFARKKQEVCEK